MTTHFDHQIPQHSSIRAWIVCVTAALFFFYEFLQIMMFNAINPGLMNAFHVTAKSVGVISSTYFIANILFMFPAGVLLDRFSTRIIIIVAMVFCVLGTVGFSWATHVNTAAACRFLSGIGGSFPFLCCLRLSSRWFPPKRWALASGVMVTIAFLGGIAGQAPMTWLVAQTGWRQALQWDALLGVIFIALIVGLVRDYPPQAIRKAQPLLKINLNVAIKNALANRQNWFYGSYTSMLNLPVMLLGAIWGSTYLKCVFGLTALEASEVTSMIFFGTIIGSPVLGGISDWMGLRKLPMLIAAILSLLVLLIIIYSTALSFQQLIGLFFMLGFLTSAQVISYPAISESNPHAMSASSLGLASVLIMIAPALFQPLFGWLMDLGWQGAMQQGVPIYTAHDFHHALMIMPIAFLVGILMIIFARETYCRIQTTKE